MKIIDIAVYAISAVTFTGATVAKHNNFAKVESENTALKERIETVRSKVEHDTLVNYVVDTVEKIVEKKCPECPSFSANISLKPSGYIFRHNDKYYQAFTYDKNIGVFVLDTNLEVKSRRPEPEPIKSEPK